MSYFHDLVKRVIDLGAGAGRWVHTHDLGMEAQEFHEFVTLLMAQGLKGLALTAERALSDESQRFFRVKVTRTTLAAQL